MLTGATITLSMRIVGVLLVGALIVIPVMVSLRIATGLRTAIAIAIAVGILSALPGLTIAFYANISAGGSIVLTAVVLFILTLAVSATAKWTARFRLRVRTTAVASPAAVADVEEVPSCPVTILSRPVQVESTTRCRLWRRRRWLVCR